MKNFSFKELEQCYLKATYPIEIGKKTIEKGEVVAKFDKIQIAGLDEVINWITANGGFDNRPHVFWETTKEIDLTFSQGVFSNDQFALMTNSKLFEIGENESVVISETEILESDEKGEIQLKEFPISFFVYSKETGEKLTVLDQQDKKITIDAPFKEVVVSYTYNYVSGAKVVKIGNKLFNGFLELEGRTRVKDDTTGQVVTGIIKIPKLKLMTGLSIRLGAQAIPIVASFKGVGVPVGSRGNSYVSEFYFLNNDIDSDF